MSVAGGRRLSELVKLLDELERDKRKNKDDDVTNRKHCRQYINRVSSYVVTAAARHGTTLSGEMFVAILVKRIVLLMLEQVCCWRETIALETQPLFAAIHIHNTTVHDRKATVTLAEVMDTIVLTRVDVVCRRVEREGVCKWWMCVDEEQTWLREMVTVVETQTDMLMCHGVSVSAAVRMMEGRIWKEVGRRLRDCDGVCALLTDLSTQEHSFSAGYKCVWYLVTARETQQHTSTAVIGLNSLLVALAVQAHRSYRPTSIPTHTHLSTTILLPVTTALQHAHTEYTKVTLSPLENAHHHTCTPTDHICIALYLDTIRTILPFLVLLLHTMTSLCCWLAHGLTLSLSSSRMVSTVHLLLEEGVTYVGALREMVGVVSDLTPHPITLLAPQSPHWLLIEQSQSIHSEIRKRLEWMEAQLMRWCECFFAQWQDRCCRLLDQVFPSAAVWGRAGRKSRTTATSPSPYITPLIDQLLGPLCEAASHLSLSPQQALVKHTVTLLLYELRSAILNCRHQLRPVTCCQLQVDLDQLISFLVSADSRLEQQTREIVRKLPVCVDMRRGLGALAREEREKETSSLSLVLEGELGRLLNQVTLLNNISLSELDWK